jgi:hypothetical protein
MDELGVLCYPKILDAKTTLLEKISKDGKKSNEILTELNMVFVWRCAETDAQLEVPWYGQGLKDTEQGIGNALTYAERYFLLKFFKIPTDSDDPDAFLKNHKVETMEEKTEREAKELAVQEKEKLNAMYSTVMGKVEKNKTAWIALLTDEGLITRGLEDLKTKENLVNTYNKLPTLSKKI